MIASWTTKRGGVLLNVLRAAKLRRAAELVALCDLAMDPALRDDLTRHARDEAEHAWQLLETMNRFGARAFRVPRTLDPIGTLSERNRARDVRQVHADGGVLTEPEFMELTATALVAERWLLAITAAAIDLVEERAARDLLVDVASADERHAGHLAGHLAVFERRFSRRAVSSTVERLECISRDVTHRFNTSLLAYSELVAA
jgi:bacterioferritin (cytochrome b1)